MHIPCNYSSKDIFMFAFSLHLRFYVLAACILLFVAFVQIAKAQDDGDVGRSISAPSASASEKEEDFFDASQLVPQGEQAKQGPNTVNPSVQPASKFIIVRQNHTSDSREAQVVSAERALNLGRYDSALQLFDVLHAENKRDSRVAMGRAVALQRLGRFDEAMGMYELVSELEPKNVDVKVNMLGLLATRYPAVALRRMLGLYEGNRGHAGLVAQIAVAYAQSGDVSSALQFLGVAASMEPNNANHLFNYAVVADRAGQKQKAIDYYERSLEVDTIHGGGRSIPRDAVYDRLSQIR